MNLINGNLILGSLLLLGGASILLKLFFDIDIPIFKLFFAAFLIWAGISILMSNRSYMYWQSSHYRNQCERDENK